MAIEKEYLDKPKRVGLSGPEKMFWDGMDAIGATVTARIIRSQADWETDIYSFKITRADGSEAAGLVPWDLDTFSKVLALAKGDK
jgi:hypothetical protein